MGMQAVTDPRHLQNTIWERSTSKARVSSVRPKTVQKNPRRAILLTAIIPRIPVDVKNFPTTLTLTCKRTAFLKVQQFAKRAMTPPNMQKDTMPGE